MSVDPFSIRILPEVIADLRDRLAHTRWPDEIEGAGWTYGADLQYMRELAAYWQHEFEWSAQEALLNQFQHCRAEVDGLGIHFIHERGAGKNSIPLLVMHGWPSSFWQMRKIIPLLTQDHGDISFDLVVPSLPGYGFSDRPTQPGMGVAKIGHLFHKLMTEELGYTRYGLRSSDLGAGVASQMVLAYPQAIIGNHTSGTNPYIGQTPDNLSPAEQAFVEQAQKWSMQEMAYAMQHSSKPQTVAYGLNDSPVGLAAWIVEKFRRWSDCDGDVERRFSKDDLLTNLTIYWATETIYSSMRLYYETMRESGSWGRSTIPTAYLMPSKDMFPTPREWVERFSPVDRWTEIDKGGHFLEFEEPELVAQDLKAFFSSLPDRT